MRHALSLLAVLAACSDDRALIEDTLYQLDCDYEETNPAWDADAGDAPTPTERLTGHTGAWDLAGTWTGGGETTVTVAIAPDSSRLPTLRQVVGGADAASCGNTLSLPVIVTLTTSDGAVAIEEASAFDVDPNAAAGELELRASIADVGGTWDPESALGENEALKGVELQVTSTGESVSGQLSTIVEGQDADTAWEGIEVQLSFDGSEPAEIR
jgi:hypothetical protein